MSSSKRDVALSDDLRARILAEVARTPSPTRSEERTRGLVTIVAGVLGAIALFFATGRFAQGTRPTELVAFTAVTSLVAAIALERIVASRRSMLGRPRSALVVASVLVAPVLALLVVVGLELWPSPVEDVEPASHLACGGLTLLQSVVPLVVLLLPRRGSDPVHPAVTGAALGVAAGAWAATMAYLRCPHAAALHCILAHVVPVLLLAAAGALVGRSLLRIR